MSVTAVLTDDDKTITISISGAFTYALHREFRDIYKYVDDAVNKYVIDFAEVEYLDSSALGMLLLIQKHAQDTGVDDFVVTNCQQSVLNLFQLAHFGELMSIEGLD